jgi:hypothetical protein
MINENDDKQRAAADLVRIADAMETAEPGSAFAKQLSRDYKDALERTGISQEFRSGKYKGNEKEFSKKKRECFEQIIRALDDFENWQASLKEPRRSHEIIFSYPANYNGFPHEIQLCQSDPMYKGYSGYAAFKSRVTLFSVKQLAGFPTIEMGVLKFAMDMLKKSERAWFIKKYVVPYNERVKKIKTDHQNNPQQ